MAANIFILLFCGTMAWLIFHFQLRRSPSPIQIRRAIPFCLVLSLFLLFNALLAHVGRAGLAHIIHSAPVTTQGALEDDPKDNSVLLVGKISPENGHLYRNYVAYVDDTHLWSPTELLIELKDGVAIVDNDNYETRNWTYDTFRYLHLAANDPVVVIGHIQKGTYMLGSKKGKTSTTIQAEIIYAGSLEEVVDRAKSRITIPTVLVTVNLTASGVIILLPLFCWIFTKKNTEVEIAALRTR